MPLKSLLASVLLVASLAAQTPDLPTYQAALRGALAAIDAGVSPLPQPKPIIAGLNQFTIASWQDGNRGNGCTPNIDCTWNQAAVVNAYTDALARLQVEEMDCNIDPLFLRAAPEYSGTLPGTCPGGYDCLTLAVVDQWMSHAQAAGLKIHWAPTPTSFTIAACGLTASSNEAALESCFVPLYAAAVKRYPSLYALTMAHEFGAGGAWNTALPMTLSVSDVRTYLNNTYAAVHAANASVKIGAAVDTMFPSSEAPYHADWIAHGAFRYIGYDLYPAVWNAGQYPAMLAATATLAAAAQAAGFETRINETNRPPWVPSGALPTGTNAIEGNGNVEWANDGLEAQWLATVYRWGAAHGFTSISVFETNSFLWNSSDPAHDDAQDAPYMQQLIAHLSELSAAAPRYQAQHGWRTGSIQGRARITGRARIAN